MICLSKTAIDTIRECLSEQIDLTKIRSASITLRTSLQNIDMLSKKDIFNTPKFELEFSISTMRHGTFQNTLCLNMGDITATLDNGYLYPLENIFSDRMVTLEGIAYWSVKTPSKIEVLSYITPRHTLQDDKKLDIINVDCIDRISIDDPSAKGYIVIHMLEPELFYDVGEKLWLDSGTDKAYVKKERYLEVQSAFERLGRYDLLI